MPQCTPTQHNNKKKKEISQQTRVVEESHYELSFLKPSKTANLETRKNNLRNLKKKSSFLKNKLFPNR
jgi:hypothetical protein